VKGLRHPEAPAAVHQNLATEVQLEEKLVKQWVDISVVQNLQDDGDLHTRSVDVQFEDDEIFWRGELFDETSGRVVRGRVCRDGSIEEVIETNVTEGNMSPEVFRFKEREFPAKDLIDDEAKLTGSARGWSG
jgi:hypothetical protein